MVERECPSCGGEARRLRRRPADRILSLVVEVHRYECRSAACGWEGIIRAERGRGTSWIRRSIWGLILLLSLTAALALVAYVEVHHSGTSAARTGAPPGAPARVVR